MEVCQAPSTDLWAHLDKLAEFPVVEVAKGKSKSLFGKIGDGHEHAGRWVVIADKKGKKVAEWLFKDALVITVHVGPLTPDGHLPIVCTTMSGEEVAEFGTDPGNLLQAFRVELAEELCKSASSLQLMLANGHVLSADLNTLPLAEVLECDAEFAAAPDDMI